ncbi:hypothetical protein EVAR_82947_1 [Eumeta japonica]|uniref:Uncharacterized protein n=1 Tax=Eumeta variegata TaxID=151549 RepID=A0A4C1X4R8_EUMVA|nr:hypothetical protein EVAR_82947_1 [Eumeta japonica]
MRDLVAHSSSSPHNRPPSASSLFTSPLLSVSDILFLPKRSRTTDPDAVELYNQKIEKSGQSNFLAPDVGMALVKSGGYAFHIDITKAYRIVKKTFASREICELQEIQLYPAQHMAAVVAKNSPYRELVTYGLRRMQEVGIYDRQKKVWDEPQPACARAPDGLLAAVTVREFSMALCILVFGIVLAFLILVMEITVFKLDRSKVAFIH